jgi:HlyD family secretion protein
MKRNSLGDSGMKTEIESKQDIEKTLEIDHNSGPVRLYIKYATITLAVIIAAIIIIIWIKSKSSAIKYKTEQIRQGDLAIIVTATGTLKPTEQVDVGVEVSGTIKTVEVDYNSRVKTGQILARLDTAKLEAQATQYRAALESAKAKALQTRATITETLAKLEQLKKVRELSNSKIPSQLEMYTAEAAYERAKADATSADAETFKAQATLQATEIDLVKSVIKSPINGIVLTRSIEPGQTVAASFTTPVLFTIAKDLTKMELHVNVDEADIGKIQEGQKANFSVAAWPKRTFEADIKQARYGSTTTSGVVTYETVLKVNNEDLLLRPGMTATADITVKNIKNAILMPSAALRFTPPLQQEKQKSTGLVGAILPRPPAQSSGKRSDSSARKEQKVWILKDNKLSAIPVIVGSTNGNMAEILSGGVKPGMAVAVDIIEGSK